MISPLSTGVTDNSIREDLRHHFLSVNFPQAIPTVRVRGIDKIKNPHGISTIPQILAHAFIQFRFWVCENQGISPPDGLKNHISDKGPGFLTAAGAVNSKISIESGIAGEAYDLPLILSENNAVTFFNVGYDLQDVLHLLLCHEACRPICALVGIGEVAFVIFRASAA